MTGGGPGTATTLLSFHIWKESFSMYDFGAGAAVAFIVVADLGACSSSPSPRRSPPTSSRMREMPMRSEPILTALGAFLILLFTAGPILLAFAGSVIPDRVMFASDRGLFDEVTLENYRFIFTGELPPAYLKSGANRTMISDAARQAPRSLWNSAQIALAALAINLHPRHAGGLRLCALRLPGKEAELHVPDPQPRSCRPIALITPIYMMIQAAGLIGSKFAHHLGARDQGAALHRADPVGLLPQACRTELFEAAAIDGCTRFQSLPPDRRAAGAAADGGDRPLRLHALLCGVHVLDGALRRRQRAARRRW